MCVFVSVCLSVCLLRLTSQLLGPIGWILMKLGGNVWTLVRLIEKKFNKKEKEKSVFPLVSSRGTLKGYATPNIYQKIISISCCRMWNFSFSRQLFNSKMLLYVAIWNYIVCIGLYIGLLGPHYKKFPTTFDL